MKLRIAGAQIPVTENVGANLESINRAIDYALGEEADILLTPEGSLSGYTHAFNQNEVSSALDSIVEKAKGRLGLALGTCYVEEDGLCYDQIRFYDKKGLYLGFHSKILLCSSLTDPPKGEIERYAVKPLRTFEFEGLVIGGLVCNDMWANPCCTYMPDPHLSQQLARMGAKVVFHAVNGGRNASYFSQIVTRQYHESNLLMRAKAGGVWIATVDNCLPEDVPCSSPGGVIDPEGNWVARLPAKGQHFFSCTIDVN
ncbi:MAG: carbon-nitrogen hydrolase family protein [Candidatus Brockarchaeota archaeon]|nr:carbon-nitrogen hydrolase family protein [Candidatus Brockarchaeota archaeon]